MPVEKVAIVTPEYYGSAMVGGLAMAVSGLTRALKDRGLDVKVVMPKYKETTNSAKFLKGQPEGRIYRFEAKPVNIGGVTVYHIMELNLPEPYTYTDLPSIEETVYRQQSMSAFYNSRVFSAAVPFALDEIAEREKWVPDVIHLHEWQDASSAFHLRESANHANIPVVVTTHNANYAGRVPHQKLKVDGFPDDSPLLSSQTSSIQIGPELFLSLLEMGIHFSDAVTTVSPTYAKEILDGATETDVRVVRRMQEKGLVGILNGIDHSLMNPSQDKHIYPFDLDDMESVAYGKGVNKLRLHQKFEISSDQYPMQITMMSRLVGQKGIDDVLAAVSSINELKGVRLLIVGEASDEKLRNEVYRLSGNIKGRPNFFGPEVQHLILAGSDAILMPSRYEPCGYTQLEGMRYGAVPIATHVGGLVDTVTPFDGQTGYGFIIKESSPEGIIAAIKEAHAAFQNKGRWRLAVRNALQEDFSWSGPRDSVGKYIKLYNRLHDSKVNAA